jgi:hypothetical protein
MLFTLWAFIGGLVGTAAMDGIKYIGHKASLLGGVKMDLLGRWALGMLRGKFVYADIHHAESCENEVVAGWFFHYLTGGLVALGYPVLLWLLDIPLTVSHVGYAVLFGLGSSIFPWFMVYPAFGVGFFGVRAPKAARPVITSIVSHACYGAGIGLFLTAVT